MTRLGIIIGILVFVAVVLAGWLFIFMPTNPVAENPTPASKDDLITLDSPLPGGTVQSPLTISGKARGGWYFEAQFPVKLNDANGKVVAEGPAHASGDWMTTEYVPFSITLTFTPPTTSTGTLVLEKDNPSDLPQNANQLEVPIVFAQTSPIDQSGMHIKLYFYNPALDKGPGGVLCSTKGLVAVDRVIPKTTTPLKDSIQLLLRGELTSSERASGITTEFPLPGVSLQSAAIQNRVATLTFADPQDKTSGGSCRVAVLSAEIEATAKQFPTVGSVIFAPADVFQP
jgi:hypothetical protein